MSRPFALLDPNQPAHARIETREAEQGLIAAVRSPVVMLAVDLILAVEP
jgi:hypothetical protein